MRSGFSIHILHNGINKTALPHNTFHFAFLSTSSKKFSSAGRWILNLDKIRVCCEVLRRGRNVGHQQIEKTRRRLILPLDSLMMMA